jgi:hypothetical protein
MEISEQPMSARMFSVATFVMYLAMSGDVGWAQVLGAETFSTFVPDPSPRRPFCGKELLSDANSGAVFRTAPALQIIDTVSTTGSPDVCRDGWYRENAVPKGQSRHYRYWMYPVEATGGMSGGYVGVENVFVYVQFFSTKDGPQFLARVGDGATSGGETRKYLGVREVWHLITISVTDTPTGVLATRVSIEPERGAEPFFWTAQLYKPNSYNFLAHLGQAEGEGPTGMFFNATGRYFLDDAFVFSGVTPPAQRLKLSWLSGSAETCMGVDVGAMTGTDARPFINFKDSAGNVKGAGNEIVVTASEGSLYLDGSCAGSGVDTFTLKPEGGVNTVRLWFSRAQNSTKPAGVSATSPSYLIAVPLELPEIPPQIPPTTAAAQPLWSCQTTSSGGVIWFLLLAYCGVCWKSRVRQGR